MGVELDPDRDAHRRLSLIGDDFGCSVALSSDGTTALIGAPDVGTWTGRGVRLPRLRGGLVGVELDPDRDAHNSAGAVDDYFGCVGGALLGRDDRADRRRRQ